MLTFDKKQMTDQIELLPKRLRVVFAAACAQRQLPNYVRTSAANPIGNLEAAAASKVRMCVLLFADAHGVRTGCQRALAAAVLGRNRANRRSPDSRDEGTAGEGTAASIA